ncbi:helix-turn-helix domain-containing protein [Wolbachia endosymbiont of Anopheles demeilloni]|uniref:helix-turn-helix domain-containing protein n=1 Tax=Wolbachia endosymbiont of Anopheles demeilloni TaxID=2748871 RepID=UPI001F36B048|nr:helix-turn-helix transcriptional regulator [Wolbachia endosymbiont of Anopheles demeilloni]UIP93036.1 helix-turn-helix domain-containing protein [Wolbachia endosymbiont of Anopheles demeilloni]
MGSLYPSDISRGKFEIIVADLKSCRKRTKLGKRIGVSYRQIQKYENGSNCVLASRLYDLAKALSIDVANFFTNMHSHSSLLPLCQV